MEDQVVSENSKVKAARVRSPQYPSIGLKEAIDKVKVVYEKEKTIPTSQKIIASHMGYSTLNGKSLRLLAALKKYGLLEGRGEQVSVSNRAITIIAYPPGEPEREEAIREAANMPELFKELDNKFNNGEGSDATMRAYLMTHGFAPKAADSVVQSYRETKNFVESESAESSNDENEKNTEGAVSNTGVSKGTSEHNKGKASFSVDDPVNETSKQLEIPLSTGMRRMAFALDEGDVLIHFPEKMSRGSVDDLKDYFEIFFRKIERQSEEEQF